jgi:hypothetical protein
VLPWIAVRGDEGVGALRAGTLLEVERSGGAAGLFTRARIGTNGAVRLRRPPAPELELQLDAHQAARLRSLVAGAHFSALCSTYFLPRSADHHGFAWRITHADKTVTTRDGEAPRGLAALMDALRTLIEESAFAGDPG